ncbi:MAG: efflux RND transporter periplasmic adaptor subunit [Halothiobacillaceae bacterium]
MRPPFLQRHRSTIAVLAVALLVAVWIVTGVTRKNADDEHAPPEPRSPAVSVGVQWSSAQAIDRIVTAHGELRPEQVVDLRAKTGGEVAREPVREGETLFRGDLILELALDDREARLRQAEAAVAQAKSDYQAAQRLADDGFQSRLRVDAARAELEAARAARESIELEIEHTRIRATIDGVLDRLNARQGDFVQPGERLARLVDNDPLRAVVDIAQQRIHEVRVGQKARIEFLDGRQRTGEVIFVSRQANRQTRTFRAEIRLPNPDHAIPAGISVTVRIPVERVQAHAISPALITQDDRGRLGVKIVETDDQDQPRARLVVIEPVRAETDRLWVRGLPDEARLITMGQGFVTDGDPVSIAKEQDAPGRP